MTAAMLTIAGCCACGALAQPRVTSCEDLLDSIDALRSMQMPAGVYIEAVHSIGVAATYRETAAQIVEETETIAKTHPEHPKLREDAYRRARHELEHGPETRRSRVWYLDETAWRESSDTDAYHGLAVFDVGSSSASDIWSMTDTSLNYFTRGRMPDTHQLDTFSEGFVQALRNASGFGLYLGPDMVCDGFRADGQDWEALLRSAKNGATATARGMTSADGRCLVRDVTYTSHPAAPFLTHSTKTLDDWRYVAFLDRWLAFRVTFTHESGALLSETRLIEVRPASAEEVRGAARRPRVDGTDQVRDLSVLTTFVDYRPGVERSLDVASGATEPIRSARRSASPAWLRGAGWAVAAAAVTGLVLIRVRRN